MRSLCLLTMLGILAGSSHTATAENDGPALLEPVTVIIEDFEDEGALERWTADRASIEVADTWASHGARSLRITYHPGHEWAYCGADKADLPAWADFSEFEQVELDMWNPALQPVPDTGLSPRVNFHTEDSRVGFLVEVQPQELRRAQFDIHHWLTVARGGRDLDPSTISSIRFYAKAPTKEHVRYIDNIRVTRDLGAHFEGLAAAITLLGNVGVGEAELAELNATLNAEKRRLAALPVSKENVQDALSTASRLEAEMAQYINLRAELEDRLSATLQAGSLTPSAHAQLSTLAEDLSAAHSAVARIVPDNPYVEHLITRLNAELQVMEAAHADARRVLAEATPSVPFVVGWHNPSEFLKPYGSRFEGSFGPAQLAGAKGESVGIQLIVFALSRELRDVGIGVKLPPALPPDRVKLFALGFMNRGPETAGTTAYDMQWYPDILYPAPDALRVPALRRQPYLLEVSIPRNLAAGDYHLQVTVNAHGHSVTVPVLLHVYRFEMPQRFSLKTTCGTLPAVTEDGDALKVPDGPTLIHYGLDPGRIYGGYLQRSRRPPGLFIPHETIEHHCELGQQLFQMATQGDWHASQDDDWLRRSYGEFLNSMEQLGIPRDNFFFYGFDEVLPSGYETMAKHFGRLREMFGIPTMCTINEQTYGNDYFPNACDIWCIAERALVREQIEELRQAGCKIWWYDNNMGFVPDVWLSRHKGWFAKHWGMDGYLIYSVHAWHERGVPGVACWEKWLDLDTLPYSNWQDPGSASCALLYYAGKEALAFANGPDNRLASFRLWNFRAGLYDFEYLKLLEQLVGELQGVGVTERDETLLREARELTQVPLEIIHCSDVEPLLKARARAAELIEQLQHRLRHRKQ